MWGAQNMWHGQLEVERRWLCTSINFFLKLSLDTFDNFSDACATMCLGWVDTQGINNSYCVFIALIAKK